MGWYTKAIYNGMVEDNLIVGENYYELDVHSGGRVNNVTVSYGEVTVHSGGIINSLDIQMGGDVEVCEGASAHITNWTPSQGDIYIENGGKVTFASTYSGVYMTSSGVFSHAMTMNNVELNTNYSSNSWYDAPYADVYVMSGGRFGGSIANRAAVTVWSGGSADDVSVLGYGEMYVLSGARATNIEVLAGGEFEALQGSYVSGLEAEAGALVDFAIAPDTVFAGTSNGTKFNFSSIASNFTVEYGMDMEIQSGGSAVKVTVEEAGELDFDFGAYGSGIVVSSGGFLSMVVGGETYVKGTVNGSAFENNRGYISGYTQHGGGELHIQSNGSATDITTTMDGEIDVTDGGVVTNVTLSTNSNYQVGYDFSGGLFVGNGGAAYNVIVEEQSYCDAVNGGYISGITVKNGATLVVEEATVVGLNAEEGAYIDFLVDKYTCIQGTSAGKTIDVNNGVLNGYVVDGNDQSYICFSAGCSANNTVINSACFWGWETIEHGEYYQGGIVYTNTVANDSELSIYSYYNPNETVAGDVLINTTMNNGSMYIDGGVVASGTKLEYAAEMTVDGGSAYDTAVNNGAMFLYNGGYASKTTVNNSYCSMYLGWDTKAENTVVNYGTMDVGYEARAVNTVVNSGGYMAVAYYGTAESTIGNDSYLDISGAVVNTTLNNGAMNLWGSAKNTVIDWAGMLTIGWDGNADGVTLNNGTVQVAEYGSASNITVNNSYCTVNIQSCGSAADTTLNKGTLYIGSEATHSGKLYIGQGATVSAAEGSTIDFSLIDRASGSEYMINDLAAITGTPDYTITISDDQRNGTYKLAQGAANFNGTVTVKDEWGWSTAELSVNETYVEDWSGRTYSLNLNNGNLTFTVSGNTNAEAPDTNILQNGVSQILAWDSAQGKVGYMATNGEARPSWKGVWEWSGSDVALWRVAGVGHFQGTEVDYDGVLLYNGVGNRFAAWTDLGKGSYGYVNLCKVDGSFSTKCLADLNGNEYDDILIYDTNGSIGVVLDGTTYRDIWHVNAGEEAAWEIIGAGEFWNSYNDTDSLLMLNKATNFVYRWDSNDTSFSSWDWSLDSVFKLEEGWEVAAIGDFEGDGVDDIMVLDTKTNNVWVYDDGDTAHGKRWRGTLGEGFKIEAVGDYNGDGRDDLLLREYNTGWGGMGYWGAGYAGNWVDLKARIETDMKSSFDIIA